MNRQNTIDRLIACFDRGLRTLHGAYERTGRRCPDGEQVELSQSEAKLACALMRVNHAGEVAAQGLYHGQGFTAKLPAVRDKMDLAAAEEGDHLDWCRQRINELGGHTSFLDPAWYVGSFCIGAIAGLAGDKWSLGFVAETEHQVGRHLATHLERLPKQDARSRAIVTQMSADEAGHANMAKQAGAAELPPLIKRLMGLTSKVMTMTAHYV